MDHSLKTRSIVMRVAAAATLALFVTGAAVACDSDDDDNANTPAASSTTAPQTPDGAGGGAGDATEVSAKPALTDPNLQMQTIDGLTAPTQLVFLGADDLLVTEKTTGDVVRVQGGKVTGPVIHLAANSADERGVLGIALHPDFAQNHYVYVYWTWTGVGGEPDGLFGPTSEDIEQVPELGNRIDRFTWDGAKLTYDRNIIKLPSRTTDLTLGRRRGNHDAGVLKFGPDGKLYLVMGDQNERGQLQNVASGPAPQDPEHLLGVVLRINDDGSPAPDNPFVNVSPDVARIFIYGLRNSFGYDFDPKSGQFWIQVNGQAEYDQIGRYEAGDNIGWIQIMGPPGRFDDYKAIESATDRKFDNPSFPPSMLANSGDEALTRLVLLPGATYRPPLFAWRYAVAPAGLGFVNGSGIGDDYDGDLLVGDVNTGSIWRFKPTADRMDLQLDGPLADRVNDNTEDDSIGEMKDSLFATGIVVATDIKTSPDGSLWIASNAGGALYHITKK
jgi:glucose/arabinose dehydrogenase